MILLPAQPVSDLKIHRIVTIDAAGVKRRWTLRDLMAAHPKLIESPIDEPTPHLGGRNTH